MSQASKRKRRGKALPALGIAGVAGMSLSLMGAASASTGVASTDVKSQNVTPHEIFLGEEEISDVSLSTFYVFDKENAKPQFGAKLAWWRGCGGAVAAAVAGAAAADGEGGCGGCGGCGCCFRWGRCAVC